MSTRAGGVSTGGYSSLNLRHGLGDDPQAVDENLARFRAALGAEPQWLRQVHGTRVVRLPLTDATDAAQWPEADAAITTQAGIACAVQVADCLPVLFAVRDGRGVGAAHAGWRGLSAGVLEKTVAALCEAAGCAPADIEAWLGPCIGPLHFEVGADVLAGFGIESAGKVGDGVAGAAARFAPIAHGKWRGDLAGLARDRLAAAGVADLSGGTWCTVEDGARFFSFRRDTRLHGHAGRMAAALWIEPRR
jgi:hypothetical protein